MRNEEGREMNLLIENVNLSVSEEDVYCLFGDLGGLLKVSVRRDSFGFSEGIVFAQFETVFDVNEALKGYDGFRLFGKKLRLTQIDKIPNVQSA